VNEVNMTKNKLKNVGTYRLRVLPVPATLANQIDSCGYDSCGFKGMTQYAIKDIIGHKGKNQ